MSITKEKSHEHLKLLFLAASAFLAETFADNLIFVNTILKLQTEVIISDNFSNNALIDCLDLTESCIEYFVHRESIECKVFFLNYNLRNGNVFIHWYQLFAYLLKRN